MENKRKKIITSAFIILFAVALSSYLIFSPESSPSKDIASVDVSAVADSIDSSLSFTIKPLENLTDQFTDQALSSFVSKNSNAVGNGEISFSKSLPEADDVQEIISNIIDEQIKSMSVSDSDILINSNNSKETQQFYLIFVDGLIKNNLSAIPKDESILDNSSIASYFSGAAIQFGKIADILSALKVPLSWKDIHKQIFSLFLGLEKVIRSFATADNDPLRFLIASNQVLTQEADESFNKLKILIDKKIKDEGLI
jgi:hypothetical protein